MRFGSAIVGLLLLEACFSESGAVAPDATALGGSTGATVVSDATAAQPDPGDSTASPEGETEGLGGGGGGSTSGNSGDDPVLGSDSSDDRNTAGGESSSETGSEQAEGSTTAVVDASSSSTGPAAMEHAIFITANVFSADLGGLDGADAICESLGVQTGVDGSWVAVLADASHPLSARIAIAGPVMGLDDAVVSDDANAFFSGVAQAIVTVTESGESPLDTVAWVGAPDYDCNGWTSSSAAMQGQQANSAQAQTWLYGNSIGPCSLSRSLYCISQ